VFGANTDDIELQPLNAQGQAVDSSAIDPPADAVDVVVLDGKQKDSAGSVPLSSLYHIVTRVLPSVCLSVCVSVCLRAYLWNLWTDLHDFFCADPLWSWLGPRLAALRYVMYFRFYG